MIEQAFHAYTKVVETKFEDSQRPPTTKGGLVIWPNQEAQLRHLVEQLEEGPEFSALLEATRSEFRSDDWHSARDESSWRDSIRNFFRRSGLYTNTFFKGSDTPCDWFKRYENAFQCRSVLTTYLAPLGFVKFPKPKLKFSGFEIRRFERKEFEKIAGNKVNRVFYPYAVADTDALEEYWFIVVKKPEKAPRLRPPLLTLSKEALGFVSPEYTRFPPAIEHVLERLVLFDWLEKPQKERRQNEQKPQKACWPYGLPFGFETPFVIRVNDNDLQRPKSAPDCSTLNSYGIKHVDPDTEEEYKGHCVVFDLNESRVVVFEQCIKRADECLAHLEQKDCDTDSTFRDTYWPFIKVAMGNLIKAFFTDGLEQLLWHITALEALLSEPKQGVTAMVARRIAAILGTSEWERKQLRKQFKDLYDFRSDLVHGREFEEELHRKQLFDARMLSMRAMIWFVHHLGEIAARIKEESLGSEVPTHKDFLTVLDLSNAIWFVRYLGEIANRINGESWKGKVPQREDFLILLGLSNGDRDRLKAEVSSHHESLVDLSKTNRTRLKALLNNLPNGFPAAPDWSP